MVHQALNIESTFHRFELKTNSYQRAYEKAFNLYGVLIIPTLIGGFVMYNVFQLRDEYFTIAFSLLVILLININIFLKKTAYQTTSLKLIIQNDSIQLLDSNQIYIQEDLRDVKIDFILCGKKLKPAIKISHEGFEGIIIGLKNIKTTIPIEVRNKLCLPDYQLTNQRQAALLVRLICNDSLASTA